MKDTIKYAVMSMDVEDWYHTGYLKAEECRQDYSMLDGLDLFIETLNRHAIPAQLFVLSDLIRLYPERFRYLLKNGEHELASHGKSHIPPLQMTPTQFRDEIRECSEVHREILGAKMNGFRASRFMLDRERLDIVLEAGCRYDSSVICRKQHADFDFRQFETLSPHILRKVQAESDFFEFRLANFKRLGMHWPVSGGGAMRILPWWMTEIPLQMHGKNLDLYSFYIHPMDVSHNAFPPVPANTSRAKRLRMDLGRMSMTGKLEKLIQLLKSQGFQFTTYRHLCEKFTSHQSQRLQNEPAQVRARGSRF